MVPGFGSGEPKKPLGFLGSPEPKPGLFKSFFWKNCSKTRAVFLKKPSFLGPGWGKYPLAPFVQHADNECAPKKHEKCTFLVSKMSLTRYPW